MADFETTQFMDGENHIKTTLVKTTLVKITRLKITLEKFTLVKFTLVKKALVVDTHKQFCLAR